MEVRNRCVPSTVRENAQHPSSQTFEKKPRLNEFPRGTFTSIRWIIAALSILLFITVYTPSVIEPEAYNLPTPPNMNKGILIKNNILSKSQSFLENELLAAESIVLQGNYLYTGTADGRLIEIVGNKINEVIRLGRKTNCDMAFVDPNCGRPLGIRYLGNRRLLVVDTFLGIFEVDFQNKNYTQLIKSGISVEGEPLKFINDIDIFENYIFFTDSSSKWSIIDYKFIIMEAKKNGRLLVLDRNTGKIDVILRDLFFPNGVQVAKNGKELFIAETGLARILKINLNNLKHQQQPDLLIDNLPCLPDNIRQSTMGELWIPCAAVRDSIAFLGPTYDLIGKYPGLRKLITKLLPRQWIYPLMDFFETPYGLVILVDQNGKYMKSFHDPQGTVTSAVSQATDNGTHLFLGSFKPKHLACLKL
ncbi:Adipocyte plasma membrane-associated protein [Trichinella pseudospiralis]|uniref:Adipocyte plasma membrane-associated protein n=1 Tax=Trichinella pseudospiralis TaxID=6337 RepID=A0A0V1E5M4_TRIPS|nr:Adipocyte plasma membrane-associated protein [Trichinella pseudospiralis]KRZ27184.1 Adipocyte plasma membrane-associated protein [Trichinella pseudospiralis]KRZ32485.1 Adipocyte plasma membrane-associated protein [Trichinella pseudospiralis]